MKFPNELSFEEYLMEEHGFDMFDIENIISSDELDELHEMYEDYLKDQQ